MRIQLIFIALVSSTFMAIETRCQPNLTQEEQLLDLKTLKLNLVKYHPGIYRYTPKGTIDQAFHQVEERIKPQPIINFYADITWLLAFVRCGHTRASLPPSINNSIKANDMFLPITVKYLGNKLYIDQAYANENILKKGDKVLSINNKSVLEITAEIFSHIPSDGFITSGKYKQVERYFNYFYQLYIEKNIKTYKVEVSGLSNDKRTVQLSGQKWESISIRQTNAKTYPPLALTINNNSALLRIKTFDSRSINNKGQDYYTFLENSFAELKKAGVKNLILDLRGNGGGDDNYGAALVSYFARSPFRYFQHIEVTDSYSSYGTVQKNNNQFFMTSHKGLSYWEPQNNRFEGKLYVLIDGFSFSTCADVATVLHHHKLATFIGEETGGGYDGNTSGNSKSLVLPFSKIRINIPMWKYTTANVGHTNYGRGVSPDFYIHQTPYEFLIDKDVVLDKALELIK